MGDAIPANDIVDQQAAARERWEREQQALGRKVRLQGIAMAAIGLGLNGVNVLMIVWAGRYFVLTLCLGPLMFFLGLWLTITGRPLDPHTGKVARWATAGMVGSIALGLLVTVAGFVLLSGG